ncbi:hypothetical protein DFH09DRAFT_1289381 [Mycena vulgaris]|nr:hypothetical protein DFH09DRAFT_1289381 [Mycena vulgaris]
MRFNRVHCFALFSLIIHTQRAAALTFAPVIGPFATGEQVLLGWTLDGSEPAEGWELWFNADGAAGIKVTNIAPLAIFAAVPFPSSGNGTFQGLAGTTVLATSNEVDVLAASSVFVTGTATFSASITLGATSSPGTATTETPSSSSQTTASSSSVTSASPSSISESSPASARSGVPTNTVLGIIVGTLAVIAIIVIASIFFFIRRRRRVSENRYPFADADVEKQLAKRITPFNGQSPPRWSSLPLPSLPGPSLSLSPAPPTPGSLPSIDSRRQAYLNSQLQRLEAVTQNAESESIVFGPLSSVPSESTARPFDLDPPAAATAPLAPESSRRAAYLSEQLHKLSTVAVARRPSDASVIFGPLSSVPSEDTVRAPRERSASNSTGPGSPIHFRHGPTSPVTPVTRVAPW